MSAVTKYVPSGASTPNPASARPSTSRSRLRLQRRGEPGEVRVRQPERHRDGRLQRAGVDEGQELLDPQHRGDQRGRAAHPADLPAGAGEGLAGRGDPQRPLPHPGQRGQRHVRRGRVGKTRCSYTSSVTAYASCSWQSSATSGQLVAGEDLARSGCAASSAAPAGYAGRTRRAAPPGRSRTGRPGRGAASPGGGPRRPARSMPRTSRSTARSRPPRRPARRGPRMLAAIASVAPAVTTISPSGSYSRPQNRRWWAAIGRAQRRDARARRVLVVPAAQRLGGRGQHLRRAVGVGEALAEVDRAGAHGERGHLGEDGGAERPHPGHQRVDIGERRHLRQPTAAGRTPRSPRRQTCRN